jgi:phage baseplate assembly protein W
MTNTYRGFSTVGRINKFRVTDFALIKRDLLNHFNIRKGEKLMHPNFGTNIWNILYDPLTEELKSFITAEVNSVVKYDPRINIDNVVVTEFEHGLQLELNVRYLTTNQTSAMTLQFNKQSRTVSTYN